MAVARFKDVGDGGKASPEELTINTVYISTIGTGMMEENVVENVSKAFEMMFAVAVSDSYLVIPGLCFPCMFTLSTLFAHNCKSSVTK